MLHHQNLYGRSDPQCCYSIAQGQVPSDHADAWCCVHCCWGADHRPRGNWLAQIWILGRDAAFHVLVLGRGLSRDCYFVASSAAFDPCFVRAWCGLDLYGSHSFIGSGSLGVRSNCPCSGCLNLRPAGRAGCSTNGARSCPPSLTTLDRHAGPRPGPNAHARYRRLRTASLSNHTIGALHAAVLPGAAVALSRAGKPRVPRPDAVLAIGDHHEMNCCWQPAWHCCRSALLRRPPTAEG